MATNRQLFLAHLAQTSPAPLLLEIEKAEGVWLYATGGKKYLDLISGIAVANVGHSHPAVVNAVKEQAEKHMHVMVYGEVVQSPQVQYARALTALLPSSLSHVYFTNSGAEAIEGAMKLAKRHSGKTKIISFRNAYHGSTQGALSIMGSEALKNKYRPLLPDVLQLEYNNLRQLEKISCRTAAVVVEPVQGESGVTPAHAEFLQQLRQRCTEMNALLIFDEAQSAFGRTGKMFAFEHYGVVPDVLVLAKALGGGMPLGAFIASEKLMSSLTENPALGHITTFGGHPVCCAAGLAALGVLQTEKLAEQAEAKGVLFEKLLARHGLQIRRKGLMMATVFESFEQNKKVIDRCIESGVLTDWFLFAPHCLRIAPPLTIREEEIELAAQTILNAIAS